LSHSDLPDGFSTAEAQIAARRKDYAKAAALARTPSQNVLTDPATVVIDALLDEGDWRAAAEIAKAHDPRKKELIPGFDDMRADEYVRLYEHLALSAARAGDDDAAAAFLTDAKTVDRAEVRREDAGSKRCSPALPRAGCHANILTCLSRRFPGCSEAVRTC
jgi:hypothetical protein